MWRSSSPVPGAERVRTYRRPWLEPGTKDRGCIVRVVCRAMVRHDRAVRVALRSPALPLVSPWCAFARRSIGRFAGPPTRVGAARERPALGRQESIGLSAIRRATNGARAALDPRGMERAGPEATMAPRRDDPCCDAAVAGSRLRVVGGASGLGCRHLRTDGSCSRSPRHHRTWSTGYSVRKPSRESRRRLVSARRRRRPFRARDP